MRPDKIIEALKFVMEYCPRESITIETYIDQLEAERDKLKEIIKEAYDMIHDSYSCGGFHIESDEIRQIALKLNIKSLQEGE